MNKTELVHRIASGTGLTQVETEAVVNGFIATVSQALREGERVELRGFGTFDVQPRAARTARNPRTDEPIYVPAHTVAIFRPAKDLRAGVRAAHPVGTDLD